MKKTSFYPELDTSKDSVGVREMMGIPNSRVQPEKLKQLEPIDNPMITCLLYDNITCLLTK